MAQTDRGPSNERRSSERLPVNPRRHKVPQDQRKRVTTACNSCNVRRIKCSGERPCTQCRSTSRECVYPTTVEKVSVSRTELEELRARADALERTLRDAVPDERRRRELVAQQQLHQSAASPTSASPSNSSVAGPSGGSWRQREISSPSAASESVDDGASVAEGRLLHDAAGHPRFFGGASDTAFLDHLKEFINATLVLMQQDPQGLGGSGGSQFLSTIGACRASDLEPVLVPDVEPLWLPSGAEMSAMLAKVRSVIQDGNGSWPSGGIYWWGDLSKAPEPPIRTGVAETDLENFRPFALFHAAAAVAVHASTTSSSGPEAGPSVADVCFSRAAYLLRNPLEVTRGSSIHEVGALALMAFYLVEVDRLDAAYLYVSAAARLSMIQGAHRACANESGKRVFWTVYILDRSLSTLTGRPPNIPDDVIRLPLPADAPSMPPAAGIRSHIQLARISGYVVHSIYGSGSAPADSSSGEDSMIRHLEKSALMLEQWQQNLPTELRLSTEGLSSDPAVCSLHMLRNQLLALASRPLLFSAVRKAMAERMVTGQTTLDSHPYLQHLNACIGAAHRNIRLAVHLSSAVTGGSRNTAASGGREAGTQRPQRPLLHASLHHVFSAAVTLMLQELSCDQSTPLHFLPTQNGEVSFAIERFLDEARAGGRFGRDGANALREMRILVARLRASPMDPNLSPSTPRSTPGFSNEAAFSTSMLDPGVGHPTQGGGEDERALFDELTTLMVDDWPGYNN